MYIHTERTVTTYICIHIYHTYTYIYTDICTCTHVHAYIRTYTSSYIIYYIIPESSV